MKSNSFQVTLLSLTVALIAEASVLASVGADPQKIALYREFPAYMSCLDVIGVDRLTHMRKASSPDGTVYEMTAERNGLTGDYVFTRDGVKFMSSAEGSQPSLHAYGMRRRQLLQGQAGIEVGDDLDSVFVRELGEEIHESLSSLNALPYASLFEDEWIKDMSSITSACVKVNDPAIRTQIEVLKRTLANVKVRNRNRKISSLPFSQTFGSDY